MIDAFVLRFADDSWFRWDDYGKAAATNNIKKAKFFYSRTEAKEVANEFYCKKDLVVEIVPIQLNVTVVG